jgi:hypothetical protein
MGSNFHTPWVDGVTHFNAAEVNPAFVSLDAAITKGKNLIVHCDGAIDYHPLSGILYWSGVLRFIFNATDGKACTNQAAAGSVQLDDNEFAYVDLSETNGAEITVEKTAVVAGSASNFIAFNRIVLGYRNAVSNDFFPVALRSPWPNTVGS